MIEGLEERAVPTITPSSYTAQFVQGYVPAASVPILMFTNTQDFIGNPNNYTLQIAWGDGTTLDTTGGAIQLVGRTNAGSTYQVFGNHTYANTGSFSITVTIHDLLDDLTAAGYSLAVVETPNQHFVQQIYAQLLNRAPDTSGMTHFIAELNNGVSRYAVVQEIQGSGEYHALVVQQLYQEVLGRTPDTDGLNTWTKFLANGGTADQLEEQLLGSQEYYAKNGSTNAGFLAAVYQLLLHRTIDASGATTFGNEMVAGRARSTVTSQILGSTEGSQIEVEGLYQQILGRQADSSGLASWSSALLGGQTKEQVSAQLLASDEFFAKVGPVTVPNLSGVPSGL
jgi:hypothetical protein